jgi:hypothetical protein
MNENSIFLFLRLKSIHIQLSTFYS